MTSQRQGGAEDRGPGLAGLRRGRGPAAPWRGPGLAALRAEEGFLTVQFVAATGLSLVVLVVIANLIVFQYGRGVVRAGLDEGVRAGSRAGAGTDECLDRAGDAVRDLLGGAMGEGVRLRCDRTADRITASADVHFRGWLPVVPDWRFEVAAVAVQETAP
jgi:hypothetical protein